MLPQFLELFSELLKTQRLGTHNPHSSYFHKIAKQLKSPEVGGDYTAYPQFRDLDNQLRRGRRRPESWMAFSSPPTRSEPSPYAPSSPCY